MEKLEQEPFSTETLDKYGSDLTKMAKEVIRFILLVSHFIHVYIYIYDYESDGDGEFSSLA